VVHSRHPEQQFSKQLQTLPRKASPHAVAEFRISVLGEPIQPDTHAKTTISLPMTRKSRGRAENLLSPHFDLASEENGTLPNSPGFSSNSNASVNS